MRNYLIAPKMSININKLQTIQFEVNGGYKSGALVLVKNSGKMATFTPPMPLRHTGGNWSGPGPFVGRSSGCRFALLRVGRIFSARSDI